jgi:hypothetical protein
MIAPPKLSDSEVTVKADGQIDRKTWVQDMTNWAQQHRLQVQWTGESSHWAGDPLSYQVTWHEAHFFIADKHQRTLFLLRWS